MKPNKSGKRMYSDSYIDVATSNKSARLIAAIIALSLQGLRDVTAIAATADLDVFTYERAGEKYFVRMDGNNIAERNLLSRL